jgi:signal transduction histidine kinase
LSFKVLHKNSADIILEIILLGDSMKKIALLFFIVLNFWSSYSQEKSTKNFYKEIRFLNQKNDSLSIEKVIKLYKKGDFSIPLENKVFYKLKGKQTSWLHFKLDRLKQTNYFSIWNPTLEDATLFLYNNGTIVEKERFSLLEKNSYKKGVFFPTWKLDPQHKNTDVFVKINDHKDITSLKVHFSNTEKYFHFIEKYNAVVSVQTAFLFLLFIIVLLLAIVKKEISLVWYSLYILFFVFEFLSHRGVDLYFGVFDSPIIHSIKKLIFQYFGIVFACLFFISFYPFKKENKYVKLLFKVALAFFSVVAIFLILFINTETVFIPKAYLYFTGRVFILLIIVLHFYAAYKKIIPFYVSIAFSLPVFAFFTFALVTPKQTWSINKLLLYDTAVYLCISIEICIIIYYIINKLVSSEFLAIKLQTENNNLHTNFQQNLLAIQHKERNTLVRNLHDSFSGSMEALRLQLTQQNKNQPSKKVVTIFDDFHKDYRYILNSLHVPKIDSENFIQSIIGFCNKIDKLVPQEITYQFLIKDTVLSQENCIHFHRIISELVTNSIKYSKGSEINVLLADKEDFLLLEVCDNGIGFDKKNTIIKGFGLNNVKERVDFMKGEMNIISNSVITKISIQIPKNESR